MRDVQNTEVVFLRQGDGAENEYGEEVEVWNTIATEWTEKRDVSDGEKISAGMQYGEKVARFKIHFNSVTETLTADDRMTAEGFTWGVLGVKELERRRWLEVTAKRRSD